MTNTLLDPLNLAPHLPAFDRIRAADVVPAVDALLDAAQQALAQVTAPGFPADWTAISRVLDTATERLGMCWSAISHLKSVADSPELRTAYNDVLPRVTEFWTQLGASQALFERYQAIDAATLTPGQRRAHALALRGFVLSGARLQGEDRTRFARIQERMAELSQKFSENTLDATDGWCYYASAQELDGLPEDVLQATRDAARAQGQDGHRLTLKIPCYLPVMQFATDRALRQRMYRAYVTRASECAEGDLTRFDNTAIIGELLTLRQEEARLLGFGSYGELSLQPKMADTPEQVLAFLRDLAARARPFAERDVADLREFARTHLALDDPQPWDWTFISERLRQARYAFSEQEVKQYFTAPRVLDGLFALVQRLFGVRIVPDTAPVWHPDVRFFRLERDGATVGQFYLDQSAREGKRGGAWMDDVRSRWLRPDTGQLQTPVAHMVCNFAQGVDGQPPLLTHDDVITLFHEMGHALHHMLTQVNERDISGINGVEWDAVELPSQFMENFCWEWAVIRSMTAHVHTGEPLPRALFDRMVAARNYQAGMVTMRQIEFALFDMLLHTSHDPARDDYRALLDAVRAEVAVLPTTHYNRSTNTFSHIFAGGYAAGYYSYKWAEVLSADAYAAFEESQHSDGTHSADTGARYLHEILERGASRSAQENFIAFRGRAPQLDALLRHQGMTAPAPSPDTAAA